MTDNVLVLLILIPLLAAFIQMLLPNIKIYQRLLFVAVLTMEFLASVVMYMSYDLSGDVFQNQLIHSWFPAWGVSFHVGSDGLSNALIVLTTFLSWLVGILYVFKNQEQFKLFSVLILILEGCLVGLFVSLDLVLFYIFWEAVLIPMYFLIGLLGSKDRIKATLQFFVYTFAGSVFMLTALVILFKWIHLEFGFFSTSMIDAYRLNLPFQWQMILCLMFLVAFAIKIPLVPFHTWLAYAHVQAPSAGSVMLAGVLLKMGVFGLMRICLPIFGAASMMLSPILSALAVVSILYGAMMAYAQSDVKRAIAYSSVSHMGYAVLGVFSMATTAMVGSGFLLISHGLTSGALFLLVGLMYDRMHTRDIDQYGGWFRKTPRLALMFLLTTLASIALPMTSGFVGEFLILVGTFKSTVLNGSSVYAVLAVVGVVLGALYMLRLFEKLFLGQAKNENLNINDLNLGESFVALMLVVSMFVLGLFPNLVLKPIEKSVKMTSGFLFREANVSMLNDHRARTRSPQ